MEASSGGAPVAVPVRLLHPRARLPGYAHHDDAGADLYACHDATLQPGERALVGTGIAIELPPGHAGFVHPRSGLASRLGVTVLNAPGTVDAGYRGEILVNLINTDLRNAVDITAGDRIAQLVVQRVRSVEFVAVDSLTESGRGDAGHGSTGGHLGSDPPPAG